jgi:hypothetical protein
MYNPNHVIELRSISLRLSSLLLVRSSFSSCFRFILLPRSSGLESVPTRMTGIPLSLPLLLRACRAASRGDRSWPLEPSAIDCDWVRCGDSDASSPPGGHSRWNVCCVASGLGTGVGLVSKPAICWPIMSCSTTRGAGVGGGYSAIGVCTAGLGWMDGWT